MANATVTTITVTKPVEIPGINLELTIDEARMLRDVVGNIGFGHGLGVELNAAVSSVFDALVGAGVQRKHSFETIKLIERGI
jgi:hypothetical protein